MKNLLTLFLFLLPFLLTSQKLLPIKQHQKWGLIDLQGNIQIQPKYDAIATFDEHGFANVQLNDRVGLLNKQGQEVLSPVYDDISVIGDGYFAVLKNSKWRLINAQKQVIFEEYEDVVLWEGEGIAFSRKEKWGFAKFDGTVIVKASYDAIQPQANFIITQSADKYGLHTIEGKRILATVASELQAINKQVYLYKKDELWGAVDYKGKQLLAPEYESYEIIEANAIQLKQGANTVLLAVDNQQIIKGYFYERFLPFSNQYWLVQQKQQFGLIDRNGTIVLTPRFDEVRPFSAGFFRVQKEKLWGIVDQKGKEVIPLQYDYIAPLNERTSLILKENQYGIIDQNAQFGVPIEYDKIVFENGQIKAYKGASLSLFSINDNGKISKEQSSSSQHITFKISGEKKRPKVQQEGNAYQLEQFEWFYNRTNARWGLRAAANGEVVVEPQFDHVEVKEDLGLTMVGLKKRNRQTFHQTTYVLEMVFGLVNNEIGKLVTTMDFVHIEFEDFERGLPLARCVFVNGKHGLVSRIGQIVERDAAYISKFEEGIAKIGIYGTLSGTTKGEGLQKMSDYLDNLRTPYYMIDYTADDQHFRDNAQLTCPDCSWGYIDSLGNTVIKTVYEDAKSYSNGTALVRQNVKWGVVNNKNKIVVPFQYDEVSFLENTENQMIKVHTKAYRYGLIDTLGHIAVDAIHQDVGLFTEGRLAVQQSGKWGFTDLEGNTIIPCRYQQVQAFSEGLAAAKLDGQWGYIESDGRMTIPFRYGKVGDFHEGLAWVTTSNGIEYINILDETVIQGTFSKGFDFEYGVARVLEAQKYGLINQNGEYVVRPKFTDIGDFDENGLAVVRYGNDKVRYGVINTEGTVVTDNNYNEIRSYSEGLAAVKLRDQWGYINKEGKLVIPAVYAKVSPFVEGRAAVQRNGDCGYIDQNGVIVVDLAYSKCLEFDSGRAVVYRGYQKAGLLSSTGEHIIKPSLNRLINFKNGRGLMRDNNYRFYFISEDARLSDGYYQEASNFQHGVAVVRSSNKWGIVNQKGIRVSPPKYDKIEPFKEGYAKVRIKGFYGLMDLNGKTAVPTNYEAIQYVGDGIFRTEKGGRIGYFDRNGRWIWKIQG
ncbi:MAG: WG repeat-containing protein [Bacteroidota bacterium]